MGVPTIGCRCGVCLSADPHDKRTRPSVLVQYGGRNVVIDSSPDFRFQALRADLRRLDAILYTHPHADHIMGLDDVRAFNIHQDGAIPIYGNRKTMDAIRQRFSYIFEGNYPFGGVAKLATTVIDGCVELFGVRFQSVPVLHGYMEVWGYRFGRNAYLTDYQHIPETSYSLLEDLEVLFVDALRREPHPTHCTLEEALEYVRRFRPRQAFFTHIAHDLGHASTSAELPRGVHLAYDGLQLEIEL